MKKIKICCIGLFIASTTLLISCTENLQVRQFGGTMTVNLPPNVRLVNVTWKEGNSLWYLTRNMETNETPETYTFQEKSQYGIAEGSVIIVESKK